MLHPHLFNGARAPRTGRRPPGQLPGPGAGGSRRAGRRLVSRIVAGVLAVISALMALGLVGIAVMLGVMHGSFHWVLVAVPAVAVVIALIGAYIASRPAELRRLRGHPRAAGSRRARPAHRGRRPWPMSNAGLSPQERLAISRRALVNHLQGELPSRRCGLRRAPDGVRRASLLDGIDWAPMARNVARHWWQRHPANAVGRPGAAGARALRARAAAQAGGDGGGGGCAGGADAPWRLLSASALAATLLKTSDVAGVVNTLMQRRNSPTKGSSMTKQANSHAPSTRHLQLDQAAIDAAAKQPGRRRRDAELRPLARRHRQAAERRAGHRAGLHPALQAPLLHRQRRAVAGHRRGVPGARERGDGACRQDRRAHRAARRRARLRARDPAGAQPRRLRRVAPTCRP